MSESVLSQGKAKASGSVLNKQDASTAASGEQSVLGSNVNHKPLTFYKKAWFWIIIAVVVLGVAGLVVFLVIQSNLAAEAIEKYGRNAKDASNAVDDYERKFSTAYSDSGLPGYYMESNSFTVEMRNKCVEKYGVSGDDFKAIEDIKYYNGETAVDEYGSSKTRELSEKYRKIADNLTKASENIKECKQLLSDRVAEDVDIKIGDYSYEEQGTYFHWYDSKLPVTITNKSDKTLSFTIEIVAYDKDGKEIETGYVYVTRLGAGKTATKNTFTSVSESIGESLKDATFKVASIKESDY